MLIRIARIYMHPGEERAPDRVNENRRLRGDRDKEDHHDSRDERTGSDGEVVRES